MKKNANMLQNIILGVFGVGIVLGVLIFSGKIPTPNNRKDTTGPTGTVLVWGVLPFQQVRPIIDDIKIKNREVQLTYVEKKPETFQTELLNALASGKGPDVFMINSEQMAQNIDRITIIPFQTYPQTVFKNTFADMGEILITSKGILGFPMIIDPMVMFYNRDIFSSSFLVEPPQTWEQLQQNIPVMTQRNDSGIINQSAVAIGTANNITHPKDMFTLRMLQEGNPIVIPEAGKWVSMVESGTGLVTTLSWMSEFTKPTSTNYSWNSSLPKDKDYFIAGKLGIYFGYMQEAREIRQKNPNLNFDIAMLPQNDGARKKTGYGKMYSVAVSKVSKNPSGATSIALLLTGKEYLPLLIANTYYAPARRDLLGDKPRDDAERALVYNSAIISRTFFDPGATETTQVITTSIGQIANGTRTLEQVRGSIAGVFRDLTLKLMLPE